MVLAREGRTSKREEEREEERVREGDQRYPS